MTTAVCHQCGEMQAPEDQFCGYCGTPRSANVESSTQSIPSFGPPGYQSSPGTPTGPVPDDRPNPADASGRPSHATPPFASSVGAAAFPGSGKRLVATLVDYAIVSLVSYILLKLTGVGFGSWLLILYFLIFWGVAGATPGKMLFNLKIVSNTGDKLSFGRAVVRYIVYLASILLFGLPFLFLLFHDEKRGLHDLVAGTRVICQPATSTSQVPPANPTGIGQAP